MVDNSKKPRMTHLDENVLNVPFEKYLERKKICNKCYAYDKELGLCKITKIQIGSAMRQKSASCPLGFWSSYYGL